MTVVHPPKREDLRGVQDMREDYAVAILDSVLERKDLRS